MTQGLPSDVLSDEPVMPEIQIKPNNAIPITIGVLLLLGALMMGYSAFSNVTYSGISDAEAQATADALNSQGANLTGEDVSNYFSELEEANYFSTLGIIESVACLVLLGGGILLLMKRRAGIYAGAAGGGLVLIDSIIGMVLLSGVEAPSELLSLTMRITAGIGVGCGVLCLALPFIPLLFASGRAALQ